MLCNSTTLLLALILLCLIPICHSYLVQKSASHVLQQCSGRRQAKCSSITMAGGFGNKDAAKKRTKNDKVSRDESQSNPRSSFPALSTPTAQKAVMDVKKIVDNLDENEDPFWQLIEPLLLSEYNSADIQRVLDFIKFSTGKLPLPDSIVNDKWRPHEDIHAFMVRRAPGFAQR
jgi:hypothetical protein